MGRRRKSAPVKREKLSVTVPDDLIQWLDSKVMDHTFMTVSEGVTRCILEGQKKYGKK